MVDNSQKTQVSNTINTYRKALPIINSHVSGGKILDYGAGLGHGAKFMRCDSFEPNPRSSFNPTYRLPQRIPSESYEKIVSLNVLNVLDRRTRDDAVKHMARILKPGGAALIMTRGRDVVKNAKGELGKEPYSITTTIGTYQKGFNTSELLHYVRTVAGPGFSVESVRLGPAAVLLKKDSR